MPPEESSAQAPRRQEPRRHEPRRHEPRRHEDVLARHGGGVELLRLPAALVSGVSRIRAGLYDRGWLQGERLEVPVVSVGNLSVGGTGKTPCVALIARELARRGLAPGLLSRGYGAKTDTGAHDEARVLEALLPGVPHVADKDRARGGRRLSEEFLCDSIVLDDGFQHRRLARDLDLVLVDALRPWGLPAQPGGRSVRALLPRGLLREPPGALARADALVLTRSDLVEALEIERIEAELASFAPGKPILLAAHRPIALCDPRGERAPAAELLGREVDLVSGLGNPEGFERSIARLGARVRVHRRFPDHHDFRPSDLDGLGAGGRWIVTTTKDAVKIPANRVHVLLVEFVLTRGSGVLEAMLDALPRGRRLRERRSLHEGLHG